MKLTASRAPIRAALAALAVVASIGSAAAGDSGGGGPVVAAAPGAPSVGSVETVYFGDRRHHEVRLVRGAVATPAPQSREIVSFGTGRAEQVTVVRGAVPAPSAPVREASLGRPERVERVSFRDPAIGPVTVVRGGALTQGVSVDLFSPADGGELDRVAFAVDGVESRHGADLRMWRPEPAGPQGPMQVSAAAAADVGGGDRFDLHQNRLLGRAYLAQMFRRYGNWRDAVAAYNWGPGNLDQWIAAGRRAERLPFETAHYIERVLRDALIAGPGARL